MAKSIKGKRRPTLAVLIPGAGPRGTKHAFFQECERELRKMGLSVTMPNANDSDGIKSIKEKVNHTVAVVKRQMTRVNPTRVIVIGHSQGFYTGGNAIKILKESFPNATFHLVGVANPRSREEHDLGFNVFMKLLGKKPIKTSAVSDGVETDAQKLNPDLTIHFKRDPILEPNAEGIPRLLKERLALAEQTHFLKNKASRREIIEIIRDYVSEINSGEIRVNQNKAYHTIS